MGSRREDPDIRIDISIEPTDNTVYIWL